MKEFNNDKDQFNRVLKEKFKSAGYEPSGNVWEGIESALLKQENGRMQKKTVWYRNIAAAVLAIALISLYFNVKNNELLSFSDAADSIEQIDLAANDFQFNTGRLGNLRQPGIVSDAQKNTTNLQNTGIQQRTKREAVKLYRNDIPFAVADGESNLMAQQKNTGGIAANERFATSTDNNNVTTTLNTLDKRGMRYLAVNDDWDLENIAVDKVSYFAISELTSSNKREPINFQANLNFGSGSFNPNANITSAPIQSTVSTLNSPGTVGRTTNFTSKEIPEERQIAQDLSSAPMRSNISVTYGANVGVNLGRRWILKSGLQYGNFRSSSESSTVVRDINSDEYFPYHGASSTVEASDGKVLDVTSSYNINNNFEILSVPLFVTYKLLDSKFGIGLVAGATADFLLENTVSGESDQLSALSFDSRTDKKSYRNSFASGTLGVEFSYMLNKNYGLTLTPLYKKALTDVTTDAANFSSLPAFASLNLSFQYIF